MRNAFAAEIRDLAHKDPNLVLLSGDIGNRMFDKYKADFPDRFYNCGVAEANMISLAGGMALSGLRPVAYTIASFITSRCIEQIRLDLCYHNVPVTIVGVGAGLGYASLGPTHHTLEDIAFLRAIPGMTVICPGDAVEVKLAMRAAAAHNGPVYLRIGKKNEPVVHQSDPNFTIGKALVVRPGKTACLLSTGNTLPLAIETADKLAAKGVNAEVVSFHTVKPLDTDYLRTAFSKFKAVVTVEEHGRIGGFGSAVAEWLADQDGPTAPLVAIGTDDTFLHESGDQYHARGLYGLTAENIMQKTEQALASNCLGTTPT
jgi:transketolase